MSILKNSKSGYFISHKTLIDEIYKEVDTPETYFQLKPELFNITAPYKPSKIKPQNKNITQEDPFESEVHHVETMFKTLSSELENHFLKSNFEVKNTEALDTATTLYNESGNNLITDVHGANPDNPISKQIQNRTFIFPQNCKFYSKDVKNMSQYLKEKYDLILLDPPWWNKYIRRKRKHTDHGYNMMYNEDLKNLPLENHLKDDGLIVVWCTNSSQHLNTLRDEIFPKWGVTYLGKWYWVKVTLGGVPVCEFAQPPRKQPFEQIIFGCREEREIQPPCDKIVISVPSALHSHKPPLMRLLEPFLPENPNCLEVFARYLLPNWTSYGNEVLRFQHESLYTKVSK